MKRFIYATMCIVSLCLGGCEYDDAEVWDAINDQEERIAALEEWQKTVNENIAALQAIVNGNDYITSVEELKEGDEVIGYTINFYRQGEVTIYNGKDGEDGEMPVIGVTEGEDGRWYWTVNGELMEDADGNPVCASGKDGEDGEDGEDGQDGADGTPGSSGSSAPMPQIKTDENGDVFLSVDGGKNWTQINGEDGNNGDSFFSGIEETGSSVIFKLANGESITVPKNCATLYCVMNSTRQDITNGKLVVPLNQSFRIVCETINGLECSAEAVKNEGNWTIIRYSDNNNSYIVSVDAISSSGSATILFTVVSESNQAFFYQVEVQALDDSEMSDYYLNTIEEHISTMETSGSLETTLNELASWIEEQPYIKEVSVSQDENLIFFTYTNGTKSFISFEDNEEYNDNTSQISRSTDEYEDFLKETKFDISQKNDEDIIEYPTVLCYAPLKWKKVEQLFWWTFNSGFYEHELFEYIIGASPININYEYDSDGFLSKIEDFHNYGMVLVTETHGFKSEADGISFFAIPINNENINYCKNNAVNKDGKVHVLPGLVLYYVNEHQCEIEERVQYIIVSNDYINEWSGLATQNNTTLYSVLCCNSYMQSKACFGNFLGIENRSARNYNSLLLADYFTGYFNGLSHKESLEKCKQSDGLPFLSKLSSKDTYPNQRYFSITTNDVTSDDAKKFTSVPVSATINGYKNLKAGIEYKIYYCEGDKEFNVTDEGILSEEVEVDEEGNIEHALTGLKAETTYSYRIGFEYADKYYYGERKKFTTGASGGMVAGKAVDLGLSVKWANYNVGASKPEEYGGWYGWGDPTGECLWQCAEYYYGWYADASYCYRQYAGGNPPDDISGSEWDYARIAWGSPWRMPTHEEALELIEKCAWEIYTENGVSGAKVTGPNGNAIFLPFSGSRYGDTYTSQGKYGFCWTSTLDEGTPTRHRARSVTFYISYDDNNQPYMQCYSNQRSTPFIYGGYPIRPVRD